MYDVEKKYVIGFVIRSIRTLLTFAGFVNQNRGQYMEGRKWFMRSPVEIGSDEPNDADEYQHQDGETKEKNLKLTKLDEQLVESGIHAFSTIQRRRFGSFIFALSN
jgi:hypothetical protein